jgi:hypothetical protein
MGREESENKCTRELKYLVYIITCICTEKPINIYTTTMYHIHAHVQDMDTDMETDTNRDRDMDRDGTWTWTWTWTTITDEATLSIDVEKMETMKRLFAFKIGN